MKHQTYREFSDSVAHFKLAVENRIIYLKQVKFDDKVKFPRVQSSMVELRKMERLLMDSVYHSE